MAMVDLVKQLWLNFSKIVDAMIVPWIRFLDSIKKNQVLGTKLEIFMMQ